MVHAWPVGGLAGKGWDHVSEKRCSGLDLLGCDPGPGYAARDVNTRESDVAYGSLRLRDGVRAAPSSSQVVSRILGAPPLWAPARVIPGRTLLEGEGRVGYRASPQLQRTSLFGRWGLPGVPVPVPLQMPCPGCGPVRGDLRERSLQEMAGGPSISAPAVTSCAMTYAEVWLKGTVSPCNCSSAGRSSASRASSTTGSRARNGE